MKPRSIAAAVLALALLLVTPALAYYELHTVTGEIVAGNVIMWLNGSSQAQVVAAATPLPTSSTPSLAVSQNFLRPANVTAYAAGQAVCTSTSADCTPLSFSVGRVANGGGLIHGIQLYKSAVSVTNASFTVHLYSGAPTVTGIHDASAYSPAIVDLNAGTYRGSASCASAVVNGDNAFYSCTLSNPSGQNLMQTDGTGLLYAMIQANGAYTPASGERFGVAVAAVRD